MPQCGLKYNQYDRWPNGGRQSSHDWREVEQRFESSAMTYTMVFELEANQAQVERILKSKAFRSSEVHRNLLEYLAEKSLSGSADALKEYTVGVDVFAKPESYDPRQESVVRMHVARLRQKLDEYYRSEGVDDPILVNVPKGGFKVTFEHRSVQPEPAATLVLEDLRLNGRRPVKTVLGTLLAISCACAVILGITLWRSKPARANNAGRAIAASLAPAALSAELQQLWEPILNTSRPLMVCLSSSDDLTGLGTASASFQLGQFLSQRKDNILLTRPDLLSMPEVLMDNVLFLGPTAGDRQIQAIATGEEFVLQPNGIRNLKPRAGEPAFIPDHNPQKQGDSDQSLALISHLPGLYGTGDILYLSGNEASGTLAAVRAFTDPTLARELVTKLKTPDGHFPRYFQAALQVRSMDSMPIEISYVLLRDLAPPIGKAGAQR